MEKRCKNCGQKLLTTTSGGKTEYKCPRIVNSWLLDYSETHSNYAIFDSGLMLNYSTACEPY